MSMNAPADDLRLVEAAKRYALAEKSDPFALRRALSHVRSGIASHYVADKEAFYNAEPFSETRTLPNGQEYTVTVWRNMVRP